MKVDLKVFNGRVQTERNGRRYARPRDGLLFFTTVRGREARDPVRGRGSGNRRLTYYNPKRDPYPPGDNALYTVKGVHVSFPRRTRRGIPWMQAPTKCPRNRRWVGTVTVDRYDGGKMTAKHAVRCSPA